MYKNKSILVTGGAGSIGGEIVRELLKHKPKVIRVLDINETGLFDLDNELDSDLIRPLIGNIEDRKRVRKAMDGVDIVFHAGALKHVPLCEYNPYEAVKTNIVGTQNVIDCAIEEEVKTMITISTDKAVNPINVMGATKLLSERLTISGNFYKGPRKTALSCVRFGNVLGTRGSVVLTFMKQLMYGNEVTITDKDMTRFFMPVPDAVKLVLRAGDMAQGGEIFVLKMDALRITDLAEVINDMMMNCKRELKFNIIGKRANEKMHEELLTEDELDSTYETDDMYIIYPQFTPKHSKQIQYNYPDKKLTKIPTEKRYLNKKEIRSVLERFVDKEWELSNK